MTELPRGRITSKGRSVVELMDREHLSLEQALERVERDEPDMADDDIEQAADKATVPTCPMCGRTSHGFACDGLVVESEAERAGDKAAGDTMPAEGWPDNNMLEAAWGLIANAFEGNWGHAPSDWREAAGRWREAYRRHIGFVDRTKATGTGGDQGAR